MTSYQQGSIAEFRVSFLDRPGGQPTDPTAISLSLFKDGTRIHGPVTLAAGQIVRDLIGVYHHEWPVPQDQAIASDYTAAWTATISGSERTGYETFDVVAGGSVDPDPLLAWATVADVARITGVSVSTVVVRQAQFSVELFAARTYESTNRIGNRDLAWLKRAVAYQAAWIPDQPDLFSRMDLLEISGNTSSSGLPMDPKAMALAPMAKYALKRVSWLRSRSIRVRSPFLDGAVNSRNPLVDSDDEAWAPLGGR